MPTTITSLKVASKQSGHKHVGPPAMSNIPPMTPATPPGVPAPFVYLGSTSTAADTSSKLKVFGGEAVVKDSKLDVDMPGNQPSQPAPIHDVVTMQVNAKVIVQ